MPIRGLKEARQRTREVFKLVGEKASRTMVEVLIAGRSYTLMLTPIDSSTLVNSAFIDVRTRKNGVSGRFGFTAAYAAAVHGMPGTLKGQPRGDFGRTGNQSDVGPQMPRSFGGGTGNGNYWDPDAEPEFVRKGFEDNRRQLDAVVQRGMKI